MLDMLERGIHSFMQTGCIDAIKILLVDEDLQFQRYFSSLFAGSDMVVCPRGIDAVSYAKQHKPDLIIMDISFIGGDGFELCRRLKNDLSTRHLPLIILSTRAMQRDKIKGLESGADDYITKPFSTGELKARIKAVIRSYNL